MSEVIFALAQSANRFSMADRVVARRADENDSEKASNPIANNDNEISASSRR
jgi:hypothetical protein